MKTAKEWELVMGDYSFTVSSREAFVRKVQADALRHCAKIVDEYSARCPMHAPSAWTVARLIEQEIHKLNEKEDT